jgi:hypothetical protein
MAFDQPLEADRVDGSSFFSTLLRAPVIGSLLWVLGHKEEEGEDNTTTTNTSMDELIATPRKSALRKSTLYGQPADSDCCIEALDGLQLGGRYKKELSWSDETGQSLVEYVGEVSNVFVRRI